MRSIYLSMSDTIFTISGFDITLTALLICIGVISIAAILYIKWRNFTFLDKEGSAKAIKNLKIYRFRLGATLFFITALLLLRILRYDLVIFDYNEFVITIIHIIEILGLFSLALLVDWLISHVLIKSKYRKRENLTDAKRTGHHTTEYKATKLVRYIVYLYLGQLMLQRLDLDFILFQREIKEEYFTVHISDIIVAIMIMMIAKVLVWFITQVTLYRMYKSKNMDTGIQLAINQLVMYVIYVFAFVFALDRIVSDMSIFYGGAAALLVGVGLGLQRTFNDFFSGLVLLFERTITVGDVLQYNGQSGKITKIGLRASFMETQNNALMLIPNSELVNQPVINWSHRDNVIRLEIPIVITSDVAPKKIQELLLSAIAPIDNILPEPHAYVSLTEITDLGLKYSLNVYTNQVMMAEDIKSSIRINIIDRFRAEKISLSYQQ
ncbi:MAG: mechanosensitive ion channel [Saprospiraceae bacterium]|nr:mechanosensitive ion channel [Saprospiraceae bacterium]